MAHPDYIPISEKPYQHSGDPLFFLIDIRMSGQTIVDMVDWLQARGMEDFRKPKRINIMHWYVYFGANPNLAMQFKLAFG